MYEIIFQLLLLATEHTATTYGFNEWYCCDIGSACPCAHGAITASGEKFDPEIASAAVPAPAFIRMKSLIIGLQADDGRCVAVRLNDKKNPRYIGNGGLDLSPKAQSLLTGKPARKTWSGKVKLCSLWSAK